MAMEEENPEPPTTASRPIAIARPSDIFSETSSSHPPLPLPLPLPPAADTSPKNQPWNPRDHIVSVASNVASQPLHNSDPRVWGVLTAISTNARKRHQGINILLTADEHCIGRLVEDVRFQIDSNSVSANHCRIYRMRVTNENMEDITSIFLKDTSTNGTYLNWEKLKKNSAAVKVCHGDIISFAAPPQHELAFAFVYREVRVSAPMPDNAVAKRKAEDFVSENKRLKGLGIGAPEGPISLDDFRSLQRSNMELRKQLENQVVLIDTLRGDNRAAVECHESELKSVKESVAKCYLDQLKELQQTVDLKQKELGEVNRVSGEQKHAMEDLNERLSASMQSCAEADAIISREAQLRAFYSTTEEIQVLFAKQQEQLKAMQRTLEDEENYENTSVDMDGVIGGTSGREKEVTGYHSNNAAKAGSTTSAQKLNRDQVETSSNEASVTEKHDCDIRSEECQNTQEAEFTSADHDHGVRGGFGSDIDGVGTTAMMEGDAIGTERVLETESPANYGERNIALSKCGARDGDTMQFDDDANVQETEEHAQTPCHEVLHHLQSNNPVNTQKTIEDTEAGGTIRTADLLTSEVAGSWACSTAPSMHGENESPRSRDNNEGSVALHDSNVLVAESQSTPSDAAATRRNERRALSEMIGIVAPDLREQFGSSAYDCDQEENHGGSSDSDTESCSSAGDDVRANAKGGSISDAETQGSDHVEEDQKQDDAMDEGDEATQVDSLG